MSSGFRPREMHESVTRVGAYVLCINDERRILLCRISELTPDKGKWTLPGGGVMFGESIERAALREFEEETGHCVELECVAGTQSLTVEQSVAFDGRPLHLLSVIYRGRIVGGELRMEVGGTTDKCDWFTEAEARKLPLMELARCGIDLAFRAEGLSQPLAE